MKRGARYCFGIAARGMAIFVQNYNLLGTKTREKGNNSGKKENDENRH